MGFNTVTVGTTPVKILGENTKRQSLILTNASTSGIVFLGPDATISSMAAATVLDAFGTLTEDSGGTRMYMGDVYGVTTSSAASVRVMYWERII